MKRASIAYAVVLLILINADCGVLMKRRLCGTTLADVLSLVCKNKYSNQPLSFEDFSEFGRARRSLGNKMIDYVAPTADDNDKLVAKESTMSWLKSQKRFKRSGILDECCVKMCTMDEIRQYCG